MPVKILKSVTGVLPVAMTTIMVSPTARPRPIMMAEKMPAEAVGSTIRMAVCHRLAPRASDPERKASGTLLRESSAMVKMMGMTAKPMTKPTTNELRCSKPSPVTVGYQSRKSATRTPVSGSVTTKSIRSTIGPHCQPIQANSSSNGAKTINSCPG